MIWPCLEVVGLVKMILHGAVKGKKETDKGKGEKTLLKSGQGWNLPAQQMQLKRRQVRKGLLQKSNLWCPDDLAWLWNRLD